MTHSITHRLGMLLLPALLSLTVTQTTNAQTAYKAGGKPEMTLYGTSTMHDWTMVAHSYSANAQITLAGNELTGFNALTVVLPVKNLKSEHDGMNDNAYEALKADDHKDIVFKLSNAKITASGGGKYQVTASGTLTIAGATRPVTIISAALVNPDGSVSCSGSVPLKLSEYGIARPSFMLGTMKVGDALTLNYALILVK